VKGYAVMPIGWEYDDERYTQGEDSYGAPEKVFVGEGAKQKAMDHAAALEFSHIRSIDSFADYGYEWEGDLEEWNAVMKEMGLPEFEEIWDVRIPKAATDEQARAIIGRLNGIPEFYDVEAVEVEGE
jgi:hypothetical protein